MARSLGMRPVHKRYSFGTDQQTVLNSVSTQIAANLPNTDGVDPKRPRAGGQPLSQQLAQAMAERIQRGALAPGARLPSVRQCAREQRVSPSTVVAGYDLLQAQGLVEARQQRGYFVRDSRGQGSAVAAAGASGARTLLAPPLDAAALIRGMFQRVAAADGGWTLPVGPGLGTLPEPWLDAALLERALRRTLVQSAADGRRYGEPAGDPGLRQSLSRRLSADLGIAATPAQIVTTLGATHALDLVARTLLSPGDAVLVDEPGWAVEFARLTRMGMRLLPVPRGADGPDLAVMARLLAEHRPRLYVTTAVLHNPTGHTLSLASAHRVLQLADAHALTIIEDDTYAWMASPQAPRLSALDGLRRTVYVSGFSKILAPSWRVGFAAASGALVERLIDSKLLSTLTTPALLERAVAWCLDQGLMRRHVARVQQRLDAARNRVVRQAQAAGCRFVTPPQGLFGWVDTGVNTDLLAERLAARGWLIAPGSLFSATPRQSALAPSTTMRINFAAAQDAHFWQIFTQQRQALESGADAAWRACDS